ncbi:MAG TPA: PA2169 family four-helix-bundle protein [Terracidiphilus sp.]|jgi:uncharacterized protein (TIGR02284 family)|nr:PA2169 family four-helix-bundle protein [Terracidiphilus sp.]
MGSPSKDLVETEGALRVIIEHLIDAQETLQKIGDEIKNEPLKRHFLAESLQRAEFRGELENILHQEGVRDLHETGTTAGAVARAWTSLKTKLGAGDHALQATAEESERSVLDAYADALKKDLPLPVRQVLATQAAHIRQSCDYVGAAHDSSA